MAELEIPSMRVFPFEIHTHTNLQIPSNKDLILHKANKSYLRTHTPEINWPKLDLTSPGLNMFFAICHLLGITGNRERPRLEACPRLPVHLLVHVLDCQYLQTYTHPTIQDKLLQGVFTSQMEVPMSWICLESSLPLCAISWKHFTYGRCGFCIWFFKTFYWV